MQSAPGTPHLDYDLMLDKLSHANTDAELFKAIVDTPFQFPMQTTLMFLGIIVLLLVDAESGKIRRIALSNTELAKLTTDTSTVPFHDIVIQLDDQENIISRAIATNSLQETTDWKYLFTPALPPEDARFNQASAGIAYSAVTPLSARGGGALIFSYYQYPHAIGDSQHDFMAKYSQLVDSFLAN